MDYTPLIRQDVELLQQAIEVSDRLYVRGVQDVGAAVWRDPHGRHFVLPPCGRCREVISDFQSQAWIIVTTLPNHWEAGAIDSPGKVRIGDLLPLKSNTLVVPGVSGPS